MGRAVLALLALSATLALVSAACDEGTQAARKRSTPSLVTSTATLAPQEPNTFVMKNRQFVPARLVVKVGTQVLWINEDGTTHIPVDDNNEFRVGIVGPGGAGSFEFDNPGIHSFHCSIHPSMKGTLVVQ